MRPSATLSGVAGHRTQGKTRGIRRGIWVIQGILCEFALKSRVIIPAWIDRAIG